MNNALLKNKKLRKILQIIKQTSIILLIIFCLLILFLFISNPAIDSVKYPSTTGYNKFMDNSGKVMFIDYQNSNKKSLWISLKDIPYKLIRIIIRIEDFRFWEHYGVDFKQLYYATIANLKSLSYKYGASTITQQLVKNLFFSRKKSLIRKFREIMMALKFENNFSKQEILEWYLNIVEMAKNIYGLEAGSQFYFSKSVSELDFEQQIFLIALITDPIYYGNNLNALFDKIAGIGKKLLSLNEINFKQYHSLLNLSVKKMKIKKQIIKQNNNKAILKKMFQPSKSENKIFQTTIDSVIQKKLFEEATKMKLVSLNTTNAIIVGNRFKILAFVPVKKATIYQKFILKYKMRKNITFVGYNIVKEALNKNIRSFPISFSSNISFYDKKYYK